ncbi:SusC/RagA family TonB-linked outer membrane protein [Empedobacter sp. UBA5987]|uniref:SusC/RagA family TonB-linked outer membrane protein n=1 Tax=Empedobacter sp. UBA5987 TaxID=1946444 RepID=UPI0025C03B56|nr:TonB-dependent receptor [Empedobacter sp. UBA5987]
MYHKIKHFKLKKLIPLAFVFLYCNKAEAKVLNDNSNFGIQAADATVKGIVQDENGFAVSGAKVIIVETGKEVITDENGLFSIEAEVGQTLTVQLEGFTIQKVVIDSAEMTIHISSETSISDEHALQEVTLVGYGTQKKSDLTGSVSQLKSEQFKEGMNISVDNLIQGKVAGVRVVQTSGEPGAGMNVSIRGVGSIRSGSTPLFVVDGVPLSNENVSSGGPNVGLGSSSAKNPLNFLNTSDIESITVLKDASASAIYGARGSNGVVLITTKQGKKGDALFTYDTYFGVSNVIKKLDLMNADEYRNAVDPSYDHGGNTDWQDVLFRSATSQNHAFSFSKKTNTGSYYASISHMDQDGIIETSNFRRTTARLNAEESFLDDQRLKVKFNLTASDIRETGLPNGSNAGSDGQLVIHALMANPTRSVFDKNGDYTNFNMNAHYNPMYLLSKYNDHTNTFRVLGNVEATLRILPGLNYKLNYGIDRSTSERNTTMYPNITDRTPRGMYTQSNLESLSTLVEHYLTFDKTFNRHNINLLAGFSYQKFKFSGTYFGLTNIAEQGSGVAPENNPGYSGTAFIPSPGYAQENELQSYFGRVNYNYDSRYLFTASLRADGSTRFGKNNKYGYFPSLAVAWAINKEEFLRGSSVVNELKLRASWGQTGNQEVQNKLTQASSSLSSSAGYWLYNQNDLINGVMVNRTANPDLKWEVVEQTNFGVDFSLFNSKLYGSLEYYNKTTLDPILNIPSGPLSPTSTIWQNVDGKIENKGFELTLGSQIIDQKDFTWSIDVNAATLSNKVKDLPVSEIYSGQISGPGMSGVYANVYKNGYQAGSFYMLKYLGIDEQGKYIYEDTDGNGSVGTEDRQIFEGPLPKVTYGLNSYMRYKRFDFAFSFIGQAGGYLVNNTNLNLNINNLASDRNLLRDYYTSGASAENLPQLSSLYLEKSDFLRLNNVRLGYNFGVEQLKWVKSLNLYVSAQNLWTITNYSGYDPLIDTSKTASGNQSLGIDYATYPSAKTFMVGATLKF